MKKVITQVLVGSTLLGLGFVGGLYTHDVKSASGEQIINGKMVKITLAENKQGGYFDLLVEPKKGVNVSTEWDINTNDNYKDLYLTGLTQEKYKKDWTDRQTLDILNKTSNNPKYSWDK